MPRREYQESLEELRMVVQQMGQLVLERLDQSLSALEHAGTRVANSVIDGDDETTQRNLELESTYIDLFAFQQPVANERGGGDLVERGATGGDPSSVKQVLDDDSIVLLTKRSLERVADYGVDIAAWTLNLVESDPELIN